MGRAAITRLGAADTAHEVNRSECLRSKCAEVSGSTRATSSALYTVVSLRTITTATNAATAIVHAGMVALNDGVWPRPVDGLAEGTAGAARGSADVSISIAL